MAERAITRRGGIGAILGTADRDFLVRNSGEQVSHPPHSSLICLSAGVDVQIRHLALLARLRLFLSCGFRLDNGRSDYGIRGYGLGVLWLGYRLQY